MKVFLLSRLSGGYSLRTLISNDGFGLPASRRLRLTPAQDDFRLILWLGIDSSEEAQRMSLLMAGMNWYLHSAREAVFVT